MIYILACTDTGNECGTDTNADCNTADNPKVCKCKTGFQLTEGSCQCAAAGYTPENGVCKIGK